MEEGAQMTFKVPPPGIEFTLPSPKIGIESLPVVDPPWMPQVKTKVEEVTISQESHVSDGRITSSSSNDKDNVSFFLSMVLNFPLALCLPEVAGYCDKNPQKTTD